mmetsp:Transcript_34365/g.110615  ORF Transcript_34365/g.110615 Transcript_34365/m.110615 type:complete len:280 (+) Transcript_34365:1059-1898(+)
MLLHQLVERLCVRAHSVHLRRADRVARHRDTHHHAARLSARKDAAQLFGGGGRLLRLPADAVLVGEERLADGVRVRDIARVNERDRLDAPAEKAAGHGTAQRACADEQAPLRRDLLRLERRHEPPPHEPDVEVDRRRGGRCRVHLRRQVHQPRAGPARRVLLPPDRGGRRRRPAAAAATRRDLGRSGRADEPRGAPLGDRCCLEIEAASEQLPHVAHVQRAKEQRHAAAPSRRRATHLLHGARVALPHHLPGHSPPLRPVALGERLRECERAGRSEVAA